MSSQSHTCPRTYKVQEAHDTVHMRVRPPSFSFFFLTPFDRACVEVVELANQGQVRIDKIVFAVTSIRVFFSYCYFSTLPTCVCFPLLFSSSPSSLYLILSTSTNFPYTTVFHIVKMENTSKHLEVPRHQPCCIEPREDRLVGTRYSFRREKTIEITHRILFSFPFQIAPL